MRGPFILSCVIVSACSTSAPAPVDYRTGTASAPNTAHRPEPITRAPRPNTPKPPAPDWADGAGTPLSAFALQPEDAQPFDPANLPKAHMVQAGDTLYSISVRYQAPLRTLIDLNRIAPPFALAEGQVLSLPAPHFHRVASGETLVGLARRYNIDARSLALLNRMAPPYVLRPGEQLVLPAFARAPARSSTPAPMVASNAPDNAGKKEQSPPPAPPAPPAGPVRFAWPLEGKVLARFGPQAGGRRSDGLDIAVTAGAPVQAAADGRVVYAGAELPGYGRLILIQHEGEWVTAYAHLGAFGAAEGARVKQGERIGTASGEKLHFQVRRRGEPTDPTPLLPNV